MRASLAAAILLISANAWAGKPTQAQAKKVGNAWLKAMKPDSGDRDDKAATAATALPFWSMAVHNEHDHLCEPTTTPTADKLGDTFDCVAGAIDSGADKAKLHAFKKTDLGSDTADLAKAFFAIKDATFVGYNTDCTGTEASVVLAVVTDAGKPKVAGVFIASEDCGE